MKKRTALILMVIFVLLLSFAPFPTFHRVNFENIYDRSGTDTKLDMEAHFVHLHFLFFQDRILGTADVYDRGTDHLRQRVYAFDAGSPITSSGSSFSDTIFDAPINTYDAEANNMLSGDLYWDRSFRNVAFTTHISDPTKDTAEQASGLRQSMFLASRDGNQWNQVLEIFRDYQL